MIDAAVAVREVFCVHRTPDGDAAALQGISLDVAEGEHLCVLGPSGSGKTTLLRVVAGLQMPSAGSVLVFGQDPGRLPARGRAWLRHRWIGFLHQRAEATLAPDLSIARAVALPLALRGASRRARTVRAAELLEAAGLAGRADLLPAQLSGGERQCAALCAALAHRPRLLLADEPTAELDAESASRVACLIRELAGSNGATAIVVAHDPALAEHADRAVRIRDGRVVEDLDGGRGSLVVSRGGWVQLPPGLLGQAGIDGTVHAEAVEGGLLLRPGQRTGRVGASERAEATPERRPYAPGEPDCAPACVELSEITSTRGRGHTRTMVLDRLTVTFEPGLLTVITGRSGAGKTTLLELLACLRSPDSGELSLDGQQLGPLDREQLATVRRTRIGYLPQEPAPIGFLSAAENIALALRLRGSTSDDAARRARSALVALDLSDRAQQRVARLSAGEAQRVALAGAIACARGLLLVDEPSSRLDEQNAIAVANVLLRAANDGQTVICATHDPELIRHANRVVELGSRAALTAEPTLSA